MHMFTTFAEVQRVSYSAAGELGGAPLVITGQGFTHDSDRVRVMAGGSPCDIVSTTFTRIVCIPTLAPPPRTDVPVNSTALYPAGRGLEVKRTPHRQPQPQRVSLWPRSHPCVSPHSWSGSTMHLATPRALCTATPPWRAHQTMWATSWIECRVVAHMNGTGACRLADIFLLPLTRLPRFTHTSYVQVMSGFFVPPLTTNYSFYTVGDDYVEVQMSPDATPEGLRRLARAPYHLDRFYDHPDASSEPVWMEAGRRYYTRIYHSEWTGDDNYAVSLRVHQPNGTLPSYNQLVSWWCCPPRPHVSSLGGAAHHHPLPFCRSTAPFGRCSTWRWRRPSSASGRMW